MELNQLTLRHFGSTFRLVLKKLRRRVKEGNPPPPPPPRRDLIDVRDLIARSSLDEHNAKAENYFSSLPTWDYHLSKPFGSPADAPSMLINLGTVIQMLELFPGARVLDFGAGSGWTSRFLTQLGCEVILLDVSSSALEIARELYKRQPVIGTQPEPQFLRFDGRRIDLSESSVDRILCFDAFHHVADPDPILAEFARVLRPGGAAAFVEPGPEHSKTEQSQFEMRTFGVIENDIDIHAIWRAAQGVGFRDLKMSAFCVAPQQLTLESYEDLLSGGAAYIEFAEMMRSFLAGARTFVMRRNGEESVDSRRAAGLSSEISIRMPERAIAGVPTPVEAAVRNSGRSKWLPSGQMPGGVSLGCHLSDRDGRVLSHDWHWEALSNPARDIEPGEAVSLRFELPPLDAGSYRLEFDCVADRVTWFNQVGSPSVKREIEVRTE